jgi:hypothetical protein
MHSAIVYATLPEGRVEAQNLVSRLEYGLQTLAKNPALKSLGEFVWEVDFQAEPEALAILISVLGQLGVAYGILQLDAAPQWMIRTPSARNQS